MTDFLLKCNRSFFDAWFLKVVGMNRSLWIIVLCAGSIMGLSVGFRQALGLFLAPISVDLELGREVYALGMGFMNLAWGLGSPITGAIADRHGAGRVVVFGGLVYVAGLLTLTISGDGDQLLLGGTLIGLGLSGSGFSVVLGTVGRMTPESHRSKALGLAAVGGSIGQFVALPYTHAMIGGFGWVVALVILAATAALILPLAYGISGTPAKSNGPKPQSMGETFRTAVYTPSFWLLNAGFFVCGFHLAFVATHLPSFLSDKGFEAWLATAALTLIGITNIIGSYYCGVLGGHFPKKSVLSLLYLSRAAVFLLFIFFPVTETTVLVFSAAIGFLWLGTLPLTSGLVGQIFGTRYMSMLFGIVFLGHQLGGFLGAWLAGAAFDAFGSYDSMWWLSIGLGVLSAAIHWPISERPIALPNLLVADSDGK